LRFAFCVLRFAFCVLRFAFCVLRFAFLRFAFCVLRFAFAFAFAFCVFRFALIVECAHYCFLDMQARNYCRGMLVRNAPPHIRVALIKRLSSDGRAPAHLMEYLKLFQRAPPSCAVLYNKAGEGGIKFTLHSRNHHQSSLAREPALRQVANIYFTGNKNYPPGQQLSEVISVITRLVFINGKPWSIGSYCEYMSHGCADRFPGLRVGIIDSFVVVTSAGRSKNDEFKTLFASISQIRSSNLQALEPYAANYRMRTQRSGYTSEYVQASALSTLLGAFPDNRSVAGVIRNMGEYVFENRRSDRKIQVLLPMARAFVI
jgi:hypothetical protein